MHMYQKRRGVRNMGLVSLVVLLTLLATSVAFAGRGDGGFTATPLQGDGETVSVDAQKPQVAAEQRSGDRVDPNSLRPVSIIVTLDENVSDAQLESVSGGEVIYRYSKVFNGASLVLPEANIEAVSRLEGVSKVYLDELMQPDTSVSPQFIGAPTAWWQAGGVEVAGDSVTVGVIDTGIWPEHPSYSDPDPAGNAYAAPAVWPGSNGFAGAPRSTCDFGDTAFNPNDAPFTCNNKLIGAYDFLDTYKAVVGLIPGEFDSARDSEGHGTHTSSTAAGNYGVAATLLGVNRGYVSGIAPRAHVIMYRVCAAEGCYGSDSVAAIDQAILDGVNTINFSISGGNSPYGDAVELAFAAAYYYDVFVAASAGNSGPGADTVAHRGPWVTTVAASTSDRSYLSTVSLEADNGDTLELVGATVTAGISTPTQVVYSAGGDDLCLNEAPAGTYNGEIVICRRGTNARVVKSYNVGVGGAGGMLLYNPIMQGLATDNYFIPGVHLDGDMGEQLNAFMDSHTGVMATFTEGTATTTPGDVMASFSSRGGPGQTLGVSKPDITAPGVQILAGMTPMPHSPEGGLPGQLFQAIQGTSMSSPHIAGAAAMIKDINPTWTPGQIKSALMLTAVTDVVKEDGWTPADAFDDGSGRVDLTRAGISPLTMDESIFDYLDYENALWQTNYPSFYHPNLAGAVTVQRTFQNHRSNALVFRATVDAPSDVTITVTPESFSIPAGGERTVSITVNGATVPVGETRFAKIYLTQPNGNNRMVFPVTFVRGQSEVNLTKTCEPAVFQQNSTTTCTVTATNTSFDDMDVTIRDNVNRWFATLVRTSVVGADFGQFGVWWNGTLAGAQPPLVYAEVNPLASPAGYLPLSLFGIAPFGGSDESITNFSVPTFEYAGELYSRLGVVSNGYVVVGGGTSGDVDFINTDLPNALPPNNVLAPFWTDLNPSAAGAMRIGVLGDGSDSWIVIDWEGVPNYSDGMPNDFQIWIGVDGDAHSGEDISFTYGPNITTGDNGFLTVGAENAYGNSGQAVYFDGVGTPPAPSFPSGDFEVDVFSAPGAPGETHTISFDIRGDRRGAFTNCAEMTGSLFEGTAYSCVNLEIVR